MPPGQMSLGRELVVSYQEISEQLNQDHDASTRAILLLARAQTQHALVLFNKKP